MTDKRIFLAVDISEDARALVAAYIDELRHRFRGIRVGWERPEKLHLTLKFLGSVAEDRIESIQEVLWDVARRHASFIAGLSGCGVFPTPSEPRILWMGVERGKEKLTSIAEDIATRLEMHGFPKEKRAYSPHLTIGRIREPRKAREIAAAHLDGSFPSAEFTIDQVTLYESRLGRTGSTYRAIESYEITGQLTR